MNVSLRAMQYVMVLAVAVGGLIMATSLRVLDQGRTIPYGTISETKGRSTPFLNVSQYSATRYTLNTVYSTVSTYATELLVAEGELSTLQALVQLGRFVELGSFVCDGFVLTILAVTLSLRLRKSPVKEPNVIKLTGDQFFICLTDAQAETLYKRITSHKKKSNLPLQNF